MKPNITSRTIYAFALSLALIGTAADANAAALVCNAASEGVIVYNKDHKIMQFCDGTRWLGMSGASAPGVLPGLTSTNIWVGNGSNAATAVTMSGDATLSNAGALTIANNAVTNAKMADDAVGIAELSATGTPSATTYLRGDNTWATVSTGLPTLTSANIWVGNGSNAATAVAISGDATLSNAGVLTIANNAVTNAKMADDAVGIAELSATGTASATTYLRGDNTWATIAAADAPTIDGLDSEQFLRSDANDTTTGTVTSTGNLPASQVMATTTSWLGAFQAQSQGSGATAGAAFITFHHPSAYAAYFGIDTDNQLKFGGWSAGANSYKVWHEGNDGTTSGLDADTLDGQESAYFTNATNLASGTVAAARLPAYTGDVTKAAGGTALTIAVGAVDLTHLSATGTKSASTFLRGDNTWAAVSGGGLTAQTTVTCTINYSGTCTTAACAAGYFRSGCSVGPGNALGTGARYAWPSGTAACKCQSFDPDEPTTCYTHCLK